MPMARRPIRTVARLATLMGAAVVLASVPISALAAKPAGKPATTLKATAVVSGFNATASYQVNVGVGAITAQSCNLTGPGGATTSGCDAAPDSGSGAKRTKFSILYQTPKAGAYTFSVEMDVTGGKHLSASRQFTVVPGPASRFSVTGVVEQLNFCTFGLDCADFPEPSYPRQIATITALDANGNVATGYAGIVTFDDLNSGKSPGGLQPMTLAEGVGYVPVLVPELTEGSTQEPYASACPLDAPDPDITHYASGITFSVHDVADPSIFGCERLHGGGLSVKYPDGFFTAYVSPPDVPDPCPSGCFTDPTNSITIDPNKLAPIALSETTQSGGTIDIGGGAANDHYFTQTVTISTIAIQGSSLPIGSLDPCTQCTTTTNYLAPGNVQIGSTSVEIGSTLVDLSQTLTFNAYGAVYPWTSEPVSATGTAAVLGGAGTTCWADHSPGYFTTVLTTRDCAYPAP